MRRLSGVALAALLLVPLGARPASPQEISNPDLFGKSLEAAEKAVEFYGAWDDPDELRRMADIGYRIAQESSFRKFPFSFYLVEMPVPNAFALPGGHIFLTRGMLDLGLSDDMLAGLLGHEIAHVVHEHGLKIQRRATLLNVLSQAALIGVIVTADNSRKPGGVPDAYGRTDDPAGDRIMGTAAAGIVIGELLLRSYSREFEDQADEEGQRLAAAAGFDPAGTGALMDLMRERLPDSKEYGYWRTHPFFDHRVRAADVRAEALAIAEPVPADAYRTKTQEVLLAYKPPPRLRKEKGPEGPDRVSDLLKAAALTAWPKGEAADRLRLERLRAARDEELEKPLLSRAYGRLAELYDAEARIVRELDPESRLLATLDEEIADFRGRLEKLYPQAAEVLAGGVYETDFLETFQKNYPEAPEQPRVALLLGDAYSRLGRPAEAVKQYLKAWRLAPDDEPGRVARRGLQSLAGVLDKLAPLQELAYQEGDPELGERAEKRLASLASSYKEIANGAQYLKEYPEGDYADAVGRRLNGLADNLYGELVLYQTVGDHAKALDRIHKILTHAPLSPAADKLREKAVVEG